jgi:Flp pilus assembly protein TadD
MLGDSLAAAGDRQAAVVQWQSALRQWPSTGFGPRPLKMKAALLNSLGRREEARQLEKQLATIGYKRLV